MPVRLDDLDMTPNGHQRWHSTSIEDRYLLQAFFEDAIDRPERVGDYENRSSRLSCGRVFYSHRFRFGYANYCIYFFDKKFLLHDAWLDPIPD